MPIEPLPNNAEVLRRLRRLQRRAANMSDVMKEIAGALLTAVQLRFRFEVDPEGRPWASLEPATVKQRGRRGFTPVQILQRRRRLFNSVQALADSEHALVGTNVVYAATHQFGDEGPALTKQAFIPNRGIPARPFLGFSDGDEDEVLDIIQRRLEEAMA